MRDAVVAELEAEHARENLWRVAAPGARDALAALRARGLRLAVVSNADGRVEAILARLGLTEHLELVVDSHFEGVEKPDPAIFQRALAAARRARRSAPATSATSTRSTCAARAPRGSRRC